MLAPGAGAGLSDLTDGTDWDAARLDAEIARRAGALRDAGVASGHRVLSLPEARPSAIADLYAAWRVGASVVVAAPETPEDQLAELVARLGPVATIGPSPRAALAVPAVDTETAFSGATSSAPDAQDPAAEALILVTSGTTGRPKAVVLSRGALAARLSANLARIPKAHLACALAVLPLHFGHGLIGGCLTPLAAGGQLMFERAPVVARAAGLGARIDGARVSFLASVPSFWRMALKLSPAPTGRSLARVHIGSAPLSGDLWRRVMGWAGEAEVVNMYGLTETANWVAGASSADHAPEDGLVGRVWSGEAGIVSGGRVTAAGEGEIALRGAAMLTRYETEAGPRPALDAEGWFRTGDLGRIGLDGIIRLSGRLRTEINRAGVKICPEEVELALEGHPDLAEVCAFAVPDPVAGEIVGAALVFTPGRGSDTQGVRDWAAGALRRDAVPERWHVLETIPKTDRGKIDRGAVRRICLGGDG